MHQEHSGADFIEEFGASGGPHLLGRGVVERGGVLLGEELIQTGVVADFGGALPALMRPTGCSLQIREDRFVGGYGADGTERIRMIRRAPVAGPVDQVDLISGLGEVMRPARFPSPCPM